MKTTTVKEVLDYLNELAPFHLQESYDNAGLIIGNPMQVVSGIVTCLDSTEAVVDEAVKKGANLVIAHHPIIFSGLKRLTGANYIEKTVIKALKSDVAIIAIHTNLDNVLENGVNEKIAKKLGLNSIEILRSKEEESGTKNIGSGVIGHIRSMSSVAFLHHLKSSMELQVIKHTHLVKENIEKVAICGGSGSFLLAEAKKKGADIFITADFKYHEFFDANDDIIIADIGHYESEKYTNELLFEIISRKFSTFACFETEIITNPVNYF